MDFIDTLPKNEVFCHHVYILEYTSKTFYAYIFSQNNGFECLLEASQYHGFECLLEASRYSGFGA